MEKTNQQNLLEKNTSKNEKNSSQKQSQTMNLSNFQKKQNHQKPQTNVNKILTTKLAINSRDSDFHVSHQKNVQKNIKHIIHELFFKNLNTRKNININKKTRRYKKSVSFFTKTNKKTHQTNFKLLTTTYFKLINPPKQRCDYVYSFYTIFPTSTQNRH